MTKAEGEGGVAAEADMVRGREASRELVEFIDRCPSAFHTVATVRSLLDEAGATFLPEGSAWRIERGRTYYTVRNNSSIVCWHVGTTLDDYHFQMAAAHGDSPSYRVKAVPELAGPGEYLRINVEGYGGMIDYSWLDRPLGVAGRALVETDGGVASRLVHVDRDVLLIPSLCIHMNRDVNGGFAPNRQVDLCPLFSAGALERGDFDRMIAEELGVRGDSVLARDLFLVNRERGRVWGRRASSSRPGASMTSSAPSPCSRHSWRARTSVTSRCARSSTTRRSGQAPSRAPSPPSCATSSRA